MKNVREFLRKKNPLLDEGSLMYYGRFLDSVAETKVCPNYQEAIDNLCYYNGIVFFKDDDDVAKKLGKTVKGLRDANTKMLYVRDSLQNPLKEMTAYYVMHQATQSRPGMDYCGIQQKANFGRLIMEAQTQYFAEKVFCLQHGTSFKEKETPSEELRMLKGGTVVSALHDFELHDAFLSKLCIIIDVDKDFFVTVNYEYEKGLETIKAKFEEAEKKCHLPFSFMQIMYIMDYVCLVDHIMRNKDKDEKTLSAGKETGPYSIYGYDKSPLSLKKEYEMIDEFDKETFVTFVKSNNLKKAKEFRKYIVRNATRMMAGTVLSKIIS